jgi:hypothetical protein
MGEVADYLETLRKSHDSVNESLAQTPTEKMGDMGNFGQREMPIRTMYYQFISHVTEHSVQIMKTRSLLGLDQSEAQLILAQVQNLQGQLEGLLIGLSDEEFNREPEGEWSVKQVLDHVLAVDNGYKTRTAENL